MSNQVKSFNGVAIGNIKNINGLTDANTVGWGQQSMNALQMGGLEAAKNVMDSDEGFIDATVDKAS